MQFGTSSTKEQMINEIKRQMEESAKIIQSSTVVAPNIAKAAQACIECIKNHGKILICGNGGSAADAQHIAAELVNKYRESRKPLPGLALSTDTSNLTSIANDFSFDLVFAKQVEALGKAGDVLIAISTSGNSRNIIEAIRVARAKGIFVIGLTGNTGGKIRESVDILINIPSNDTPRIQESHHVVYHIFCDLIEQGCT